MCYSVESSLQTTLISLIAIVYLLSSNIPHYQWLGVALIGWCGMQFDEFLLWSTEPQKECTKWNEIITLTLIPFTLLSQPLFTLLGSLCVFPWKTLSPLKKQFIIGFSVICILSIYFIHFYKPDKTCTTVSEKGHLVWIRNNFLHNDKVLPIFWFILVIIPLIVFWDKNFMLIILLALLPAFGFQYGKYTDAQASIWCFYTSYTE